MTPYQKLVYLAQDGKCFYCDCRMFLKQGHPQSRTRDHFFPKAKHKGRGANTVFACFSCNTRKADREPTLTEYARYYRLRERALNQMPPVDARRIRLSVQARRATA